MSDKPHIFLITLNDSPWVSSFRDAVDGRYHLSEFGSDDLVSAAASDCEAKGVVVFYEEGPGEDSGELLNRVRNSVHYVDLPLIAVTPSPDTAMRARLLAAGASTVCNAEVEPDHVLKEVENRCNIEPIMDELRDQLLNPFVQATVHTAAEMTGGTVTPHLTYRKQGYRIFGDHTALISIRAEAEGTVILSFPRQTSYEFGGRVLAPLGVEVTEELVQSTLAEIINIIVGQAKGKLADTRYHFTMSTPTVIAGTNHEVRYKPGLPCLVASFTGELGDFALQLCMAFPGME